MFVRGISVHCSHCRRHAGDGWPVECPHGVGGGSGSGWRLGDVVEALVKPVAVVLKMKCLGKDGRLKAGSPCAARRDALNRLGKVKPASG